MLIVGEKINTSRKAVKEAVTAKDEAFIRRLARRQHEAGAHYIDVNCGTFVHNEPELLSWLVQVVQDELGGLPLCIDSPNPAAVEAALKVHQGTAMLNSITGEKERYDALEPLVVKATAARLSFLPWTMNPASRRTRLPALKLPPGLSKVWLPRESAMMISMLTL